MSDILPSTPHPHRTARLRAFLLLALLALLLLTGALLSYLSPSGTGTRIGVGDTLTLAKDRRVLSATLRDEDALVVGEARPGRGLLPKGGRFSAELPSNGELTAALTALLAATGAQVQVDHQDGKDNARLLLTTLIPVLALTDLVWLVMLSPRNVRPTGTGWPAGRPRVARQPAATAEVVVMSSNPTVAGADLELVTAPAVKSQARKPGTAGRHLRTSGASTRSGGSGGSAGSADEEGEPQPARKRPAAPVAKAATRKAPAAPAKATGKAPSTGSRGGSGATPPAKTARTRSPAKAPVAAKRAPRGAAPGKASGAVVPPRKRSPKGSSGS